MSEQSQMAKASVELRREEERVEARSASLGKALGLS